MQYICSSSVENTALFRQNVALERNERKKYCTCQSTEYFIATEKKVLHMWSFSSDLKHFNMGLES